jgi:PIN domain nuclease of toxin-antitoxin system
VRLLLDTHIALWALADDPALAPAAREAIADADNAVHVSVASLWEIAIKHALGRGAVPFGASQAARHFADAGYRILDISAAHAITVESLPPLHADPFDRMLVAQSLAEPMRLVTHDRAVAAYSDAVMLV